MHHRVIVFLLLGCLLLTGAPNSFAQSVADPNPDVDSWVEADLRLTHSALTSLTVTGTLLLREVDTDGDAYTAREMRSAFSGANRFGRATGDEFVNRLESSVERQMENVLRGSFPASTLTGVTATVDRATLASASRGEYDPPVRVTVAAAVERTASELGLEGYSDDAIAAAFEVGAVVDTEFVLTARPGYTIAYTIVMPPGLAVVTVGDVDAAPGHAASSTDDRRGIQARLDNVGGTLPLSRAVTLTLDDPRTHPAAEEDVDRLIELRMGEIVEGADALPLGATVRLDLRSIDVAARFASALPSRVRLDFVDADGIRRLYQTGAISDATIAASEASILASLRENLTGSFGSEVRMTGSFDRAQLRAPPTGGEPLVFTAHGEGERSLPGHAAGNLDVALDLGAAIDLELDFASGAGTSTYTIHAPPDVAFEAAENGVVAADGSSVTFVAPPGGARTQGAVVLRSTSATVHHEQDATLGVTIDLKDLDISLTKALGGDLGALLIDVSILGDLRVLAVPESLAGTLDESVRLDYVSSDGLRLLRQRGILDDENLTQFEAQALDQLRAGLEGALGQPVEVSGGFDAASLEMPAGSAEGTMQPVVFRATASLRQPLSGAAPSAQAAVALYTTTQSFTLPRVQGLDTSYTFILPKGLALTGVDAAGGEASTGTAPDGRDQFTVTPEGDETQATVSMAVTPTFVVAKFWPALLLVAVVLMLLIGTPIALFVRSRRT